MLSLEQAKGYLRVDFDEDDALISDLILVADQYLRDAITNYDEKCKNPKFMIKADFVMRMLIQNFYDERYLVEEVKLIGETVTLTYPIRSMINQMEYGYYGP